MLDSLPWAREHVDLSRDYQGSVKPVGFANRGLQGRGQGSYPATRAKPVPLKRVPTGKHPNKRVTSQRLILLDLSVFGYLAFEDSFPSGAS
jgi:hypothetical protein